MRALVIPLIATVALTTTVAASATSDFRECFCWDDATETFCGGDKWYNKSACQDWFWSAFGWTIPAVIGVFVLLLFPCIFYCSRILCNCCGGRHRTYGCCCADSSSQHRFPGYSNRAIFISKLLMCVAFGAYIYYAVGGYVTNAELHNNIKDTLGDFVSSVDYVRNQSIVISNNVEALTQPCLPNGQALASTSFLADMKSAEQTMDNRAKQIVHYVNQIRDVEDNQSWGRAEAVYRYPSCVLAVLLTTVVLMFCNVRKAMGVMMILLCYTTIVEALVFIPHMIAAQGVSALCASYNETVVPVVVGAIKAGHGCDNSDMTGGLEATAEAVRIQMFSPEGDLCQLLITVCAQNTCKFTTCSSSKIKGTPLTLEFVPTPVPSSGKSPYNIRAISTVLTTPFVGSKYTILDCANGLGCAGDTQQAASALSVFYDRAYPALEFILTTAYEDAVDCAAIRSQLQSPIYGDVCSSINRRATNIAMVLGVMYLLSFLTLPIIIRGMKRFVPLERGKGVKDVAREVVYGLDAQVAQVPVAAVVAHHGYTALNEDGESSHQQAMTAPDSAVFRRVFGVEKNQRCADETQPLHEGRV